MNEQKILFNQRIDKLFALDATNRFRSIEGLRALAILMVFNIHFLALYQDKDYLTSGAGLIFTILKILHYTGHFGVDLFFVISGFLIYRSIDQKGTSAVDFIFSRTRRLLPAHFFTLIVLSFAPFKIFDFIFNLFFLNVFISGSHYYNFVTWTLGYEWLFYILLIVSFILTRSSKLHINIFVIGSFLGLALLQLIWNADLAEKYGFYPPDITRFFSFYVGVFLAQIDLGLIKLPASVKWLILSSSLPALAGIAVLQVVWTTDKIGSGILKSVTVYGLMAICFALILYRSLSLNSRFGWLLRNRFLRIIGQISYSFYLIHATIVFPISLSILPLASNFATMLAQYVIILIITILLSTCWFVFFEKPFLHSRMPAFTA